MKVSVYAKNAKKKVLAGGLALAGLAASVVPVMASASSSSSVDAITSAASTMATDMQSLIGKAVPIVVPVVAGVMVVTFGFKFIKKLFNKS